MTEENKHVLICKGAVEEVFATCTQFAVDGAVSPLDAVHLTLMQHQTTRLNADGFRVIAVAYKDIAEPQSNYRNEDESDLTLLGYSAFLDPPKVREWISSALASPDLVLEAQPPAQPHGCIVVERPIRGHAIGYRSTGR